MLRANNYIDGKTTVGLEAEFENVAPTAFDNFSGIRFDLHDDGSTRGPTYVLADSGIAVIPQRSGKTGDMILCSGIRQSNNYGMEFVTRAEPLEAVLEGSGRLLTNHIKHIKKTARTSIHIHIDVANRPWTYIRNTILWAYHLEAILFRIAAGGRSHRGEQNDYRFTRPLSNPIGARWGRSTRQQGMILWDDFCDATTMTAMLSAWGRMDQLADGRMPHYIGHRLHMVNLASVLRQGTLEWRLFDALYEHITLFVEVVAAVHVLGALGPPPTNNQPMLLGHAPDISSELASDLLGVDVRPAWGYRWQNGPVTTHIDPHYDGGRALRFTNTDIMTHQYDDGTQMCPLYRR